MNQQVYIVAAKRTAIGNFLGSLKDENPADLGAAVVKNILTQTGVNPLLIDEVVVGNILSAGQGQGIGRQVVLKSGLPIDVPGYSINMVCGSGMKALMTGYSNIASGLQNLVITGGVESMSQAPYLTPSHLRNGQKMGNFNLIDHMVYDALTDAYEGYHMGITAEHIAEQLHITREAQDNFAAASQEKALKAIEIGKFKDEIVPYTVKTRKGSFEFDTDEYPRAGTTTESLARLKPAFTKDGSVTAGNSSGLNDGAAMVMLASEAMLQEASLTPLAKIVAIGQGGVDPSVMGLGPVPAIKHVLLAAGLKLSDIELFELNEAFAVQSLGVIQLLAKEHGVSEDWIKEYTNVNGGAIALGHPVGASGSRIIVTLLHEMKKRKLTYGLASLCIGGGMGTAVIIENL